ncbi:GntR family transcriptional regulator [Jatrophihabitans sp. GAS493]|uniref:GntR family transcriptional regulator n=1 Tax=Jatrophihabitans sp. GAS493 TaxID=1907575 RepID=UPI000BB84A2A|nr:GntR family transcriptional regulator [Jatrophihabitans sp. GAS493]SOD75046.1 GntR family transcriptional regulator [Jatrophihabitans sp. GAS493]
MTSVESNQIREPKYYIVKRHLLELIGPLPPGSVIPTERDLASAMATSRTTVRQALGDLVGEGRLVRRQGAGTFIAEPKVSWPLYLAGFTEQAAANGFAATTQLISAARVRATDEVAARLDLADGRLAVRIERLRLADGSPIAVETSYLSASRFPGLARLIRSHDSLYALLRERFNVVPARAAELISTLPASPREAALLGTDTGAPMLVLGRHSRDATGAPLEWVTSWYRGDRVTFVADLPAAPTEFA